MATVPLSLKLTPLRSLQADCFLIGRVPEVVVVMVTCKGHLEGLGGSGWARVGGGTHSRKPSVALIQGLGGHFRKLTVCVCMFDILTASVLCVHLSV